MIENSVQKRFDRRNVESFFSNGKKYGVKPKFLRMQEFHLLLFYLCRAYNGELITVRNSINVYISISTNMKIIKILLVL